MDVDTYRTKHRVVGLLISLTILVTAVSCVTNRQAVYVQPGKDLKNNFDVIPKTPRTIQPDDELYIRINSEDIGSNIFRLSENSYVSMSDITLVTYLVNEKGYIRLPPLGNLYLKGLTLDEASSVIEKALIGMIATPSVTIKFVNKTVTVLGEVRVPGRYTFYDQRITIFQALGYAGDITTYGNRKKVMLVREKDNKVTRVYLDLTNEDLFNSAYYYVNPDDVIYVEPLKRRHWGIETFPFTLILSATSTIILILSYLHLYN